MLYTHLIAITQPISDLLLKEYLDIALVSASYDCSCAVYISSKVAKPHNENKNPILAQSCNMLAEFSVPFFSDEDIAFYEQSFSIYSLENLKKSSKHPLIF